LNIEHTDIAGRYKECESAGYILELGGKFRTVCDENHITGTYAGGDSTALIEECA
jgi:hypothetical protein